ncbi:MAG: type I-F CRISPR-associated endoribonuclease Cas6/Csy4 [Pseudoalteromonas distincta]
MDHYIDLNLLPDPEFPAPILMNALFSKLHRVLAQVNSTEIGVSFPAIGARHMGNTLRLHGSKTALENLMKQTWLTGMRDHCDASEVRQVPEDAGHCRLQRVQAKSNAERLRRRYQKRHPDESPEAVAKVIPDASEKRLELPYVRLKSQSTGQDFPLFIRQERVDAEQVGAFNTYGFSQMATVPMF